MNVRIVLMVLAVGALAWSFWRDAGWLQLCAGLAIFLFGMQCLEEGLRQLAGGRLERLLARSTGTPRRGLLFGIGGTVLLQSSTLVSLLAIAFISSGLIQLAGGIAIIFGANLGATSGIWLLALAGHDVSLSPLALPLLVFGVMAGFTGAKGKATGRVVLGVAFIFLGIDQLKAGFAAFSGDMGMAAIGIDGMAGTLLFAAAGMAVTVALQSSHATLMLTLTALAAGQIDLAQSLAIAVGANVGSSISTAIVGFLGGNRSGQRLALAHALFNGTTAVLALALLSPLGWLVRSIAAAFGFDDNPLLQLALFHTLFNAGGVALFWPWQAQLARWLQRWLPDRADPAIPETVTGVQPVQRVRSRHLSGQALESADAAAAAVALELRHLGQLCLEVICQALCLPVERLTRDASDRTLPDVPPEAACVDAETLYQQRVKGVYGDLLDFMGRMEIPLDESHQRFWSQSQMAAMQMVKAVKDAKHLQKNLGVRLREADSPLRGAYLELRNHLFRLIRELHQAMHSPPDGIDWPAWLDALDRRSHDFDAAFRQRMFAMVRRGELDGLQAGSLMNDLGYVDRIYRNLRDLAAFTEEPESLRELRRLVGEREQESPPGTDGAP